MILVVEQRGFQIRRVGVPGADVGVVELEDAEAGIAGKQRILCLYLGGSAANSLFGEFRNGAGFAEFVAEVCCGFLLPICRIKRLWQLDSDVTAVAAVGSILLLGGMRGCPRTSKEIQDDVITFGTLLNKTSHKLYWLWEVENTRIEQRIDISGAVASKYSIADDCGKTCKV